MIVSSASSHDSNGVASQPRPAVADAPSTPSNPTVADALRRFVPDYLAKYQHRMPPHHRKVLGLLIRCRTGGLGNLIYRCQGCQSKHWVGRSCSNRHCANCQVEKTQQWLAKQTDKLLPVQHFVVTFTVPRNCGHCCAPIRKLATKRSSTPAPRRFASFWTNPKIWAATSWASSACCIPGGET